jgi:hypothetical protein
MSLTGRLGRRRRLRRLPITFLSDYGYQDDFVGVCHGVIQRIAPGAIVIDLAHGLAPRDIRAGAVVLRNTLPFVPEGVHLAVVDPGVGTERRPIALRCGSRLFVGPDNGLLWLAAEASGGVEQAFDLGESPHRLMPVSATFHGRDLFAPVAASLALGTPLEEIGEQFPPAELVRLEVAAPTIQDGEIAARVLYLDRFGNVQLNVNRAQMESAGLTPGAMIGLEIEGGPPPRSSWPRRPRTRASRHTCLYGRTFGDVPEGRLLLYEDSYHAIAIGLNGGDAAATLGAGPDTPVRLTTI